MKSIINEQIKFYKTLFTSEGWDEESADYLISKIDKHLSEEDKINLEKTVTEEELEKIIMHLKKNKSPGEDGIIAEFYEIYWQTIKKEFVKVIHVILEKEKLTESESKGILTLIHKKGEREDIKNWRPLTLLNVDYKIISKSLANRIKPLLTKLKHPNQKGFIPGRNIQEANRLIQDIIEYVKIEKMNGSIIFLDQEKAFDRVEWGWLDKCLEKYNFGD
ncbi:hypothetical protein FSP39_003749 [Pinctada imbricata]|uniref:Reverse transcriptase domain-containing protein n=1 Tax=Pinctada imbricata TaxID=66713 RepID=A0AA89BIP4_PINIB|nr:hypothetical protein FSP39_003749 [Pinctada imbricata]